MKHLSMLLRHTSYTTIHQDPTSQKMVIIWKWEHQSSIQCVRMRAQQKINNYNPNSQMNSKRLFLLKAQVYLSLWQGYKLWCPFLFGPSLENRSCQDDLWADGKLLIIKTFPILFSSTRKRVLFYLAPNKWGEKEDALYCTHT